MNKYFLAFTLSWALFSGMAGPDNAVGVDTRSLPPPVKTKVDFWKDIQPIFKEKCLSCHNAEQKLGGLRMDGRKEAMAGGYSGQVIKPGKSAESKLIHLVAGIEEGAIMPMTGERLTTQQVGLLRAWIDQGADWPEKAAPGQNVANNRESRPESTHWAFQPIRPPKVPKAKKKEWIKNPIDNFVLAKLKSERIDPSSEADRTTLIRRVSLDLIGLPPTPQEVGEFLSDNRPDAYERLVDRLLDSRHYGEKWARHWLDLARYADSDGYEKDVPRPNAWRYREWVIEALNRNMPFDEFTIEQLAGDLLPNATLENKVATGFHRNTLTNREGGIDLEEFRIEQVVDRASTTGTVWLGLTVGCARCHDHKYDPISQQEFYQFCAFFNTAQEVNIDAPVPGEVGPYLQRKPEYDQKRRELVEQYKVFELMPEWEQKVREASDTPGVNVPYDVAWDTVGKMVDYGHQIVKMERSKRTQKQQDKLIDHFVQWYSLVVPKERYEELKFKELQEKLVELAERYPGLTEAQTLAESPNPPKSHILIRGDYRQPGIEVQSGTLAVLPSIPSDPKPSRLTLARWLVSKNNPLTPRVTVNRMWQGFFGRGLVETSEDFGTRSEPPSQPELLDWLATQFMTSNWNMKHMHKLIVTSATYRQSSKTRKDLESRDPYNKLLARQLRLRLPAELVRDLTLASSGLLNTSIGGKSIRPYLPPGVAELGYAGGVKWKESEGADRYRRGLYIFFQRTVPYPQLVNFNAPDSLLACSRRERATTPLQALNLLNDPVFFEAAQGLALRLLREGKGDTGDRVDYAFRLCLGRTPRPDEKERMIQFYQHQKELLVQDPKSIDSLFPAKGVEGVDAAEAASWVGVSRVLLNLDEFITRG
jgi:Protein of unknown function (DUF1553)/Protein of unknown function (DUF1549)/Planctomycete cytochrome C